MARLTSERDDLASTLAAREDDLHRARQNIDSLGNERQDLQQRIAMRDAELDKTSAALDSTSAALDEARQEIAGLRGELASGQQAMQAMTGERDDLARRLTSTGDQLVAVERREAEALAALQEERGRVAQLNGDVRSLDQRNGALENEVAALQARLTAANQSGDDLRGELMGLRAALPSGLGGSASLEQLKSEAMSISARMRAMHRDLRRQPNNPALRGDFDAAAEQLRATQLLIAGETGGSGLYQLRPDDTLAAVAHRVLGDSLKWGRIYDRNRHVLENPDRVIAGMTLVLP